MTGKIVPAQPGIRAAYRLPGGRAVLRAVIAWELRTGFDPSVTPITLVTKDALPGSGELGPDDPVAVVFANGLVESIDGSRQWSSLDEFCAARKLALIDR